VSPESLYLPLDLPLYLSEFDGVTPARFRFRLITNQIGGRDGWYLDDIAVRAAAPQTPETPVFADGFASGTTTQWSSDVP
jgi:hypothetical protein